MIPFKRGSTFFSQLSLIEQEAKIGMTDMTESGHMGFMVCKNFIELLSEYRSQKTIGTFGDLFTDCKCLEYVVSDEK